MTFLIRPNLLGAIAGVCAVGAIIWIWLELRRSNRRQWLGRVLAALLATLALAALGLRPAWPGESGPPPAPETAALWTASNAIETTVRVPRDVPAARVFSLADVKDKPAGAVTIPDVAFLRREFPHVSALHIFGDGLNAFDADTLRGLRVILHPVRSKPDAPGFAFVRLPGELTLGEPVVVQGRVAGIARVTSPAIALIGPDGAASSVPLKPLEDGSASFTVTAPAAAAVGRFVWNLEMRSGDPGAALASERFGLSVVTPILPRVLILESSPRFDTGRLKRWLGERGTRIATRTQISRDRFRIAALNGAREDIEVLDAAAFEAFDLVLADGRTIAELGEVERAALSLAVGEHGLGLLTIADEVMLPATKAATEVAKDDEALAPWKLTRDAGSTEAEDRLARPQWPGADLMTREPLPIPPFEIVRQNGQRPLVRDGQGRPLVVATARGRGQIALTLVRETWRWPQADESSAFAGFWSYLMRELARRDAEPAGHWDVASDGGGPLFVNQPVTLRWTGSPDRAPMPAQVTWAGAAEIARLPLTQDAVESTRWQSTYWPRQAGWHRVSSPNGGRTLDFHVSDSGAWSSVRAARRLAATGRMASISAAALDRPQRSAPAGVSPNEPARGWFFALLFACLTYLWLEARSLRLPTP